jgi:hypothetical protein
MMPQASSFNTGNLGLRQRAAGPFGLFVRLLFAQLAAVDGDEARAETLDAGKVLVAGALVDLALAAELGFQRLDRQAVALHAAVATAFADQLVDHHALGRLDHGAALAAAALFGGAGLVVNDDGGALDLAELALHRVQRVAVLDRDAARAARSRWRTFPARR